MTDLNTFVSEMNTILGTFKESCGRLNTNNPKDTRAIREHVNVALAKAALLKRRLAVHKARVIADFQQLVAVGSEACRQFIRL